MPSTYSSNLGIELPEDGELDGLWGDVVNTNMQIIDRAINGSVTLSLTGTSSTLTTTDGVLSNGQYKVIVLAGSPSGTHTITVAPNDAQKVYFVYNTTAQSVVFTQGSGGNVTIATGDSAVIYTNGAGTTAAVVNLTDHFAMNSVRITGGSISGITDLAIADGGTGASDAAGARTNLGLGTAATLNVGTGANNIVQLDGSSRLPAVDGSQLTGIVSFPAGGIILWSGSVGAIPSGWALCNGLNGTPDLQDRFVVGAGSTYAVAATGGQNAITSVPAHTHGVGNLANASDGAHTHGGSTSTAADHVHNSDPSSTNFGSSSQNSNYSIPTSNASGNSSGVRVTTGAGGAHSHTITTDSAGAHTHAISGNTASAGNASVDVRPLYYALAYIMKL